MMVSGMDVMKGVLPHACGPVARRYFTTVRREERMNRG